MTAVERLYGIWFTDKLPQFNVVNIPSDGNCQFAAIAFHLVDKTSVRDVRQKVVQYLQSTPTITPDCPDINADSLVTKTGGNFDSYLTKMSMIGTWGDGLTLQLQPPYTASLLQ